MPGLLDFFNPQDPAKQQGLLSAAAALLQAGGPSRLPISTGQGIGAALGAYQQGTQDYQDRDLRNRALGQSFEINDIKLQDAKSDLANQQLLRDRQKRIADRLMPGAAPAPGAAADTQPAPISSIMFGGGAPGGAQMPAAQPGPTAPPRVNQTDAYVERMKIIAQAHADEGDIDGATKIYEQIQKLRPKFDAGITWVNGPDGKAVAVRTADDGTFKQLDGMTPREKLHFLNTGGKTIGVDEYTGAQGVAFTNSASPDAVLSAKVQTRGQNLADARAREAGQQGQYDAERGVLVDRVTGTARPVLTADGKPLQVGQKMTEDQAKATGWLVQAENAWKNMQAVGIGKDKKITSAATVGFGDAVAGLPFGIGEQTGNLFRSENRQKFNQASSSLGESLLRAATGAGVNRDEAIQKVREITPQFGDSDGVIQQKMNSIPLYIESLKIRSGPGAGKAAGLSAPSPFANPAATAPNSVAAPAPQKFDMLPAAAGFAGKRMRADNGTTYRSDGTKWIKE